MIVVLQSAAYEATAAQSLVASVVTGALDDGVYRAMRGEPFFESQFEGGVVVIGKQGHDSFRHALLV